MTLHLNTSFSQGKKAHFKISKQWELLRIDLF